METKQEKQTSSPPASFLKYPTLKDWDKAVARCTTLEQLNAMADDLRIGQNGGTIHRLKETKKMGLATSALDKRAEKLNCYKVNGGSYRQYSAKPNPHGTI
ncbi:hypothetical protein GO755_26600 [Spirosoma sp. HMF4905]|uniref:Uncharacterized protein n=1 Tax=Spirosoma arboris TaxID=2682092 RepID=A0A7K1SIJ3_9BACT|nr:hypothetical protein [Spirosoma arboris]MVM33637.1 hypothetical protein [Spirosoma arboris]